MAHMAISVQARLKRIEQQRQHQRDLGVGLHPVDHDQIKIENVQLLAKFSKCNATLLRIKRGTASLQRTLLERKAELIAVMKINSVLVKDIAACQTSAVCLENDRRTLVQI